ncbi:polysaccharide deacetylase family protein [Pelomonas sp. SE-A7]|uniref:polysaccharide deacetylase family protein n=1 Tax=Pelomonas sp. SE-A7 TaxID=3054953 RepID=UPI00259C7BA9|nr:polysaccharide deacetylase family protein [Pelomonas sp. SE-A7]MDM4766083.1 polysaccharide deacetylase family protein [Pelomonas sp. SE-A7]
MRRCLAAVLALAHCGAFAASCDKPVYLTFDTGHMGVAPLVAELLKRYDAKATFFLANEPTQSGGKTLDEEWAPWWKARAAEGHDFGSHTWEHDTWLADLPDGRFRVRTAAGIEKPQVRELSAEQYCEGLRKPAQRFLAMTGKTMPPIFRPPAGKSSPALLAAAQACGFTAVLWSPAGFLGDELNSERYPNALLLERALRDIRPGDILMAHLGIWQRQDAWAPAVLEPLMKGLTAKGMCFAPLREHPRYAPLMQQQMQGRQP